MRTYFYFFLFISTLFVSCVPQKKVVYVQSPNEKAEYEFLVKNKKSLRIEPFDMLYISIKSLDQDGYNFFHQESGGTMTVSDASLSITSYTVSDSGTITLPILGRLKLQGQTLDEAATTIKNFTKNVLNNPIVTVRFANNSVTVLGEVTRPGTYPYFKEQLNIFYALGLAGDISEYGNRRKVILIREKNKIINKYELDLTKDEIFKSDYYYLRPNDILYVSPLKIRRFGMKEYPLALILSAVTSAFLILNYFKK
ncbi:MAG TPA: polysaccharide biosynthesis/export family protein [Bacteroidia bacterium]|jgi:polysaccharide export outer membrane protein|nr:polysaccharide biosynthesis/export family protein [Bacteroidia bacterium]